MTSNNLNYIYKYIWIIFKYFTSDIYIGKQNLQKY
jgi:hypothetical protein